MSLMKTTGFAVKKLEQSAVRKGEFAPFSNGVMPSLTALSRILGRSHSEVADSMTGGTTRAGLELLHGSVTKEIIGAFYAVYNAVGYGLPESAYQRGIQVELRLRGLETAREVPVTVVYKGVPIGDYRTDLIVGGHVVVECKVAEKIIPAHEMQLLTYLRATGLTVGMILNFGPAATFRRMLLSSPREGSAIIRA